jgi:hypothetical protein
MDFVQRLNIERFERLLREEADPEKRRKLERLIQEEREGLFRADSAFAQSPPRKA